MTQVSLCKETAVWPWEQAGGRLAQQKTIYELVANLNNNVEVVLKKKYFLGFYLLHLCCQMQRKQQDVAFFLLVFAQTWTTCD